MYPWLLNEPHLDKEGMEYLLLRASTTVDAPEDHIPPARILPRDKIPTVKESFVPEVIIIRPALLVADGPVTGTYQAGPDVCAYTIRREDVAHFITEECLPGSDKWINTLPVLGY